MEPLVAAALTVIGLFASALVIQLTYQRRAIALQRANAGSRAWVVHQGWLGRILIVGPAEFALLAWSGKGLRWPIDQLASADLAPVRVGQLGVLSRTGLRLRIGVHQHHQVVEVLFPLLGGFWSSTADAASAKAALDEARRPSPKTP